MEKQFLINSEREMADLAAQLAKTSKRGDVFGLKGTLGAGKSFFARAFINSLSNEKTEVPSPTFNLLNIYEIDDEKIIYHFDFYRLKNAGELLNLGIEEALIEGISLIEWPEIGQSFFNKNYTEITIKIPNSNQRLVEIIKKS